MSPKAKPIKPPDPDRQVRFHERLVLARKTWLVDALNETLGRVDPNVVKAQLTTYVPPDVQQILAASGIRDESVFPTPIVLEDQPTLVGYYRLLVGLPRKSFYDSDLGMSRFQSMEEEGKITKAQEADLPEFCEAMGVSLAELVRRITPVITPRDVRELPLLTLGQYFQGGNNNIIGQVAIQAVFAAITEIVDAALTERADGVLRVSTSLGSFLIAVGADPDIRVQRVDASGTAEQNLLSIEVKGGTDKSNAYNRGGEAEKSHQAAKQAGYPECWTVISMNGIDLGKLKGGSPTTNVWFDTPQVVAQQGPDWEDFSDRLRRLLGM
jgi:hypothetical protein